MHRRIELDRARVRDDAQVAVGLHAPRQDPVAHERIADIDVVVGHHQPLEIAGAEMAERAEHHLVDLPGIGLAQADPQHRGAAAGLEHMRIGDAGNIERLGEVPDQPGLQQHLLDHRRFARRELADHAHHDRVLAVGDALDVEHRPGAPSRHVAGELAERTLGLGLVHRHLALDHELGRGRDLEIDGLAFHHFHRRAADAAGDRQLVLAVARGRDQIVHRIGADIERRRHRLAAHLPLGVMDGAAAVGRTEQDAGLISAPSPGSGGCRDCGARCRDRASPTAA